MIHLDWKTSCNPRTKRNTKAKISQQKVQFSPRDACCVQQPFFCSNLPDRFTINSSTMWSVYIEIKPVLECTNICLLCWSIVCFAQQAKVGFASSYLEFSKYATCIHIDVPRVAWVLSLAHQFVLTFHFHDIFHLYPRRYTGIFFHVQNLTLKLHQNYFNDFQSPKNYHLFSLHPSKNARASVWMMPKIRDSDLSISRRICLKKTLA